MEVKHGQSFPVQRMKKNEKKSLGKSTRRDFLKGSSALTALSLMPAHVPEATNQPPAASYPSHKGIHYKTVHFQINGKAYQQQVDTRTTLLDLLRETLGLTGTKKGCNHGACGACTVHIDGLNVTSCLRLAVSCEGRQITTIEGLAGGETLHPMQQAFITHDGLQCGYCTPGQIMSAVVVARQGRARTDDDIRELMSGNICRCGAYNGIVEAIRSVKS